MNAGKSVWMRFLGAWSGWLPLSFWRALSGQRLLLPFYHSISPEPLPHLANLYAVKTPAQFERDLDFLLAQYQPIDLAQLIAHHQENKPLDKPSFWLSFDDGLRECYTVIAPILQRKGIPATFFINSDFVDNQQVMFRYVASWLITQLQGQPLSVLDGFIKNNNIALTKDTDIRSWLLSIKHSQQAVLWELVAHLGLDWAAYLQQQPIYMDNQAISNLIKQGFSIGSHSLNHPEYRYINKEEQIKQTLDCQDIIQKKFNLPYRVFAFPFTDYGVEASFFDWAFSPQGNMDLTFGGAGLKKAVSYPRHLQRIPMESDLPRPPRQLLHTEYAHFFFKRMLGKHKTL